MEIRTKYFETKVKEFRWEGYCNESFTLKSEYNIHINSAYRNVIKFESIHVEAHRFFSFSLQSIKLIDFLNIIKYSMCVCVVNHLHRQGI